MVISAKETTVFSVFHPDAQDLFNTCSDLKKVAYELWDPSFRLNAEVRELIPLSSRIYIYLRWFRTKQFNSLMHLRPCFVKDRPKRLKKLFGKWVARNLSSKKNSTERGCSCTSEGMNIFTAPGLSLTAFIGFVRSCWTSKGKDYTYLYGKNVGTGSLTPFIDKAFDPRVDEWVSPS